MARCHFLASFHVMGGELVIDRDYSQSVGLLLSYFMLTYTLWLTISSSSIYCKLSNPMDKPVIHINPYVATPEEEVYIGVTHLTLYLVARLSTGMRLI